MSSVIQYFRSLFAPNLNHSRKRRREEILNLHTDQPQLPKYRRVSNTFPKYQNRLFDEDADLFQEVKLNTPFYNEILENHLMDQQQKHFKAILDDGEFSDEEESTFQIPASLTSTQRRNPGFRLPTYYQNSQPSTSSYTGRNNVHHYVRADDDDVQFVSVAKKSTQKPKPEMPSLIPIAKSIQSSSILSNGYSIDNFMKPVSSQPSRGRRSVLDFTRKNRAFNDSPRPVNSVIERNSQLEIKNKYDNLIKKLIPRFPNNAFKKISSSSNHVEPKPVATIDLSDDNDNFHERAEHLATAHRQSYTRKSDFHFKKPTFVDLSDDDIDQTHFARSPMLSSTQIVKSNDVDRSNISSQQTKLVQSTVQAQVPPINTLKEKHSLRRSLQDDAIEKIVQKFNQQREQKNRSILEEEINASKLEEERIFHEKVTQKRIDDSITTALSDKCVIIDEEEEVVDEFPPLTEAQNRLVNYALHGSRSEVIVSKFNMNISRSDLATLEGLNWLNDEVINFYMELIKERSEQNEDLPRVHVMNTFFLGKLLQQGHSGVRRWTRKVDIFSYDVIPVPVHVGGVHWCMSIIHVKNKSIKYYDSMGHPNHVVLQALEQYLKDESMDKRKMPFDTSDWTLECVRDCPQQKNGSDCGVFSCQFAEFVSRDSSISFEQQHMPYFRRKMVYEIASGKLLLGF